MSQIQELRDDLDKSLDLKIEPIGKSSEEMYDSTTVRHVVQEPTADSKEINETMKEFSKTPLFMDSLDEAGDAGENIALDAIRALQYEGTKVEVVQGFKDRGNEMVREKKWSDAKEFYSKGIGVLTDRRGGQWEGGEGPEEDKARERSLEEQCYVNRALCHLELKNYRSTTLDCASALRINPSNIKAYYRSASALLALNKTLEAEDACLRGLKLDPKNIALTRLSEQAQQCSKINKERSSREAAERSRRKMEKLTLASALSARQIRIRGSAKAPELEDAEIHLSPDALSPKSTLIFPVVLLYPMHAQSDFIKDFAETDTLVDHLTYIFPLPWDTQDEYRIAAVDCYLDTASQGMIKVGKRLSLLQALTSGKTEIVDGLVRIHVMPTDLAAKWIDGVKQKKNR